MAVLVSKCKVCGAEYESCPTCGKYKSWHAHTDTEEHYYILTVLMDYKRDWDAERAHRALKKRNIDIDAVDDYVPSVQSLFAKISAAITPVELILPVFEETDEPSVWDEE